MRPARVWFLACVVATAIFRSSGLAVQSADSPVPDVAGTVSVRENSRAVAGLTAADFVITDNGEAQSAKVVPFDSVPIDATLVIDTRHGATTLPDRLSADVQQ